MVFKPVYKKPSDLIESKEWNQILDELVDLRATLDALRYSVTLTSLESQVGLSAGLRMETSEEVNFGMEHYGLLSQQYFRSDKGAGICRFGIDDYAEVIYYWAGAYPTGAEALRITLEYVDNPPFSTENLFIHELTELRPKGKKHPYAAYLNFPNGKVLYKYGLINPEPEYKIRHIIFEDTAPKATVHIGNALVYIAKLQPISDHTGKK